MDKKFVAVIAKHTESGNVRPLTLIWDDGREFSIDRVIGVCKAASLRGGGIGTRFTCEILGQVRFLFKDEDKWFVEIRD